MSCEFCQGIQAQCGHVSSELQCMGAAYRSAHLSTPQYSPFAAWMTGEENNVCGESHCLVVITFHLWLMPLWCVFSGWFNLLGQVRSMGCHCHVSSCMWMQAPILHQPDQRKSMRG